jgi:hypothetical protein
MAEILESIVPAKSCFLGMRLSPSFLKALLKKSTLEKDHQGSRHWDIRKIGKIIDKNQALKNTK